MWINKESYMNSVVRDRLFFIICLCLPFLFVPKLLHTVFGGPIGAELVVYPIIIALIYTALNSKNNFEILAHRKKFCWFIVVYFSVLFVSLVHGLFIYPYYDLVFNGPVEQFEKLARLRNFLDGYNISYNKEVLLVVWIVIRFLKGIIMEVFYTFGFSYIIYCWYRSCPEKAIKILLRSIYIVSGIIVVYSAFELCYFWGFDWAKNILVRVNPILHAIKVNFDWWPPLLWNEMRIRSIFPEPSQFGMYAAFIIPFFWLGIFSDKKKS